MSGRVRIRIQQRDGTCPRPDEACSVVDDIRVVPFPRGRDVQVSVVNDDGTETRLRNVKRLVLRSRGRCDAVTCLLELYNPVIDVELPISNETIQIVDHVELGDGEFLGEDRAHLAP